MAEGVCGALLDAPNAVHEPRELFETGSPVVRHAHTQANLDLDRNVHGVHQIRVATDLRISLAVVSGP